MYHPWAFKDFVPLHQIHEVQLWKRNIIPPLLFGGVGQETEPVTVQWLCERCREYDGGAPKSAVSLHMECQRCQVDIIELHYAMGGDLRFQRASGKRQQKQLSYFWKYKILKLTNSNCLFYFKSKENILRKSSQRHPWTCNTQWKHWGLISFKLVVWQREPSVLYL